MSLNFFFIFCPISQKIKSQIPDSHLLISGAKAYISSASLKEAVIISLKVPFFNLKAVSDVNGVHSPPMIVSILPSIIPHTLGRGYKSD